MFDTKGKQALRSVETLADKLGLELIQHDIIDITSIYTKGSVGEGTFEKNWDKNPATRTDLKEIDKVLSLFNQKLKALTDYLNVEIRETSQTARYEVVKKDNGKTPRT